MRRIESLEDQMKGVVTYELGDKRRLRFDAQLVDQYGVAFLLRQLGLLALLPTERLPTERLPVFQCGRQIGTMAPEFDPFTIKSMSLLYDPRPGDFKLEDGKWIAAPQLGPGDFLSIPGFQPMRVTD